MLPFIRNHFIVGLCVFFGSSFSSYVISDRKLLSLERAHLDGLSLCSLNDCFDLLSTTLTHVYLQRNALTSMDGIEVLKNLVFLTVAQNQIREIARVAYLEKLKFLDVSHNLIEVLDT